MINENRTIIAADPPGLTAWRNVHKQMGLHWNVIWLLGRKVNKEYKSAVEIRIISTYGDTSRYLHRCRYRVFVQSQESTVPTGFVYFTCSGGCLQVLLWCEPVSLLRLLMISEEKLLLQGVWVHGFNLRVDDLVFKFSRGQWFEQKKKKDLFTDIILS